MRSESVLRRKMEARARKMSQPVSWRNKAMHLSSGRSLSKLKSLTDPRFLKLSPDMRRGHGSQILTDSHLSPLLWRLRTCPRGSNLLKLLSDVVLYLLLMLEETRTHRVTRPWTARIACVN